MSCKFLLIIVILLAFTDPALANWWIVRAADEKCLVVDIEPSRQGRFQGRQGRLPNTGASRSRRQRALQRTKRCCSYFHPRKCQVRLLVVASPSFTVLIC